MPKPSKSSATSATRKKHAKKTSGAPEVFTPPQKTTVKPSKKEIKKGIAPPPKKTYTPPSKLKPAPIEIDPLDSLGLAAVLPADLVVVLRRLAKKDGVTKTRALEELGGWVSNARREGREGAGRISVDALVSILPVWLYRYPALSLHPSRRIRHLSASLHASLLKISALRDALLAFLLETGSDSQLTIVLGAWCLSTCDVDRGVAAISNRSWNETVNYLPGQRNPEEKCFILDDSTLVRSLLPFVVTSTIDPDSTFATLNPSHPKTSRETPSPHQSHIELHRKGVSRPTIASSDSIEQSVLGTGSSSATLLRDGDPESVEDRNARLRVGSMGVLSWIFDTYMPTASLLAALRWLLFSPQFWSMLYPAAQPPFLQGQDRLVDSGSITEVPFAVYGNSEGFGHGQSIVRRAGWSIVNALLAESGRRGKSSKWIDSLSEGDSLGLVSSAILRSAFVELDPVVRSSMWEPLLVFLTKTDNAWMLNLEFERVDRDSGDIDDSGSNTSNAEIYLDSNTRKDDDIIDAMPPMARSAAYAEFLAFLAVACNGSPIQGYPTVLVILSTIPKEILPSTLPALTEFFDALWAAIDGQALSTLASERAKGTGAFLAAWGECLSWISRKLVKGVNRPLTSENSRSNNSPEGVDKESLASIAYALVQTQFARLVEYLGKGLRVSAHVTGGKVAPILEKLEQIATDLFQQAWMQISRFATALTVSTEDSASGEYTLSFLAVLHQRLPSEGLSRTEVERLVVSIAREVVARCSDHPPLREGPMYGKVLERLMDNFGSILDADREFVLQLDELFQTRVISFLMQPSPVLSYLAHRSDVTRTVATWRLLLSILGSSTDIDFATRLRALGVLLDSVQLDGAPIWAKPLGGELDGLARDVLNEALGGDAVMLDVTRKLFKQSGAFLEASVLENLISIMITTVRSHASPLLRDPSAPLQTLRSSLELLLSLERDSAANLRSSFTPPDVVSDIFLLAFVLPQCSPIDEELLIVNLSKQVWDAWGEGADEVARHIVSDTVRCALKGLIIDTNVRPRPVSILQAFLHATPNAESLIVSELLPTQSELDALLSSTSVDPIDNTLAVIEPLAPPSSVVPPSRKSWNGRFDGTGFSPYARGVSCLLHVMTSDRQFARENMWALHHALILALFANEVLQVPGANSPVFQWNRRVSDSELREISRQTQQIAAFLLISPTEEMWHKKVIDVLAGKSSAFDRVDSMGNFVRHIFGASVGYGSVRDSLVLHTVLQYVFRSATRDDADLWIELARNLGDKALQTSLAILLAVTEFAPEPPKLDRYRNELASEIAGISPTKANVTGLALLRRLAAVAPSPESDVIFLPQQRAVYLVQALQRWMASDEDLSEGVETEIIRLLFHLAPILQNVQGAHWEFIMDMMESNLENSSFKDANTLVLLSHSLRLLSSIQDLSASNKYLKELWKERSKALLVMVGELLAMNIDRTVPSVPRAVCLEQALSIIQDMPSTLMDENTVSRMCHLLTDSSVDVQKMAHRLLQQAAIKRTEHLVIEAGVDSDTHAIELPPELIALLQTIIDLEVDGNENHTGDQNPLGFLLGWMILFDLFTDASLKVKTAYIDQMRNLNIIGNYFLPNIFEILGVGGEGQRPFRLDIWSVDEYWTTLYDASTPQSLKLLAVHLYYRGLLTVPSLIRSWWDELKDRQLLTAVTSFTSSHFSPILIKSELMHVKPSSSTTVTGEEPLIDESFNVKVALAIHEVTATFNVDDQQMEIGVRLPAEYPLRAVEIRDIRRVGVPERLWRKWLFVVQQVVTSQNGRIVDALGLFKKNISLHFQGQVECAICYSIISVVDRSLPSKPCKTCKNRFHSSCLYKWFNTSHSSSCPLCRSDIM